MEQLVLQMGTSTSPNGKVAYTHFALRFGLEVPCAIRMLTCQIWLSHPLLHESLSLRNLLQHAAGCQMLSGAPAGWGLGACGFEVLPGRGFKKLRV